MYVFLKLVMIVPSSLSMILWSTSMLHSPLCKFLHSLLAALHVSSLRRSGGMPNGVAVVTYNLAQMWLVWTVRRNS